MTNKTPKVLRADYYVFSFGFFIASIIAYNLYINFKSLQFTAFQFTKFIQDYFNQIIGLTGNFWETVFISASGHIEQLLSSNMIMLLGALGTRISQQDSIGISEIGLINWLAILGLPLTIVLFLTLLVIVKALFVHASCQHREQQKNYSMFISLIVFLIVHSLHQDILFGLHLYVISALVGVFTNTEINLLKVSAGKDK